MVYSLDKAAECRVTTGAGAEHPKDRQAFWAELEANDVTFKQLFSFK